MRQIDKAKRKRFYILCTDKEFKREFLWWNFRIIGYGPYMDYSPPKCKGDKYLLRAYREHAVDLIKFYAKRIKLKCGHYQRSDYCTICPQLTIKWFEDFKKRRLQNGK